VKVILLQKKKSLQGKKWLLKIFYGGKFYFFHVVGNFGGILCMWDRNKLEGRFIVSSPSFSSILFTSLDTKEIFIVTNVYAPTTCVDRKILWYYLN